MLFELEAIGGPLARRIARRRGPPADLGGLTALVGTPEAERARAVWTQSAFSEYASAASFAAIASGLFAVGAPIDLSAAAADFVVDELVHAELSATLAMAFGGAVALDVDLERLVRPSESTSSLVRVAEAIVRTSCVGEALTVALLRESREHAGSPVVAEIIGRIARDEAEHAELGWTFLDWADERLSAEDRRTLGVVAGEAIGSFAPLFTKECAGPSELGVLACDVYDEVFVAALHDRVVTPLGERGVVIDASAVDLIERLAKQGRPKPLTAS